MALFAENSESLILQLYFCCQDTQLEKGSSNVNGVQNSGLQRST